MLWIGPVCIQESQQHAEEAFCKHLNTWHWQLIQFHLEVKKNSPESTNQQWNLVSDMYICQQINLRCCVKRWKQCYILRSLSFRFHGSLIIQKLGPLCHQVAQLQLAEEKQENTTLEFWNLVLVLLSVPKIIKDSFFLLSVQFQSRHLMVPGPSSANQSSEKMI